MKHTLQVLILALASAVLALGLVAWLVLAELVAATSGLGYRITTAQRFFQTDTIIGYILALGLLGLVTDQAMKAAGRGMFRWAEERR